MKEDLTIVCIKSWFNTRDNMNIYSKYVISKKNSILKKKNEGQN